jgi:hypothetical protein
VTQQLDLFVEAPALTSISASVPSSIIGLKVSTREPCKCGSHVGIIGSPAGMQAHRVTCGGCRIFRIWLSRDAANFIAAVSKKFGAPSSPIILRVAVGVPAS